jgi:phospholipid/cholesterol/gamma-HCH transport system substrate-binding protein
MKRSDEVLVGVFTSAALVVLVIGALWLSRGGLSSGYTLYAKFPWGAGLKNGQPVLLVGVTVGYVDNVELRQDGTLVTTLAIQKKYKVPQGTTATVESNGIFGDMAIALRPRAPNPLTIPAGDTVPTGIPGPTIANLTARFDTIGNSIRAISRFAEQQLVDSGGIQDLRKTMATMNRVSAQFGEILASQSKALDATQGALRRTLSGVDSARVDSTVRGLQATSQNMSKLSEDLRASAVRLNAMMAKVDSGGGTLAKLLNDTTFYSELRRTSRGLDSLRIDLMKNPKKYINLHIF